MIITYLMALDAAYKEKQEALTRMNEPIMLIAEDVNSDGAKRFAWMRVRTVIDLIETGDIGILGRSGKPAGV